MAWTSPKLDWLTNPTNPVPSDLDRIEGNIDFLKTDIETKKGAIVDALNTVGITSTITDTHAELATKITTAEKTGVSIIPSTVDQSIPNGIYDTGGGVVVGDANLVSGNILDGVIIFGVNGSYKGGIAKVFQKYDLTISGQGVKTLDVPLGSSFNSNYSTISFNPSVAYPGATTGTTIQASITDAVFLNNTTVRITYYGSSTDSLLQYLGLTVIEYESSIVKSFQTGVFDFNNGVKTIAISSVDPNKSIASVASIRKGTSAYGAVSLPVSITNNTTLTFMPYCTNMPNIKGRWYVVEFY